MTDHQSEPYVSVVVTTRNDDHGGDPLKRLQAFVNTFDEQCRRTGLDAEVIVVEWNPPADRVKLDSLLRLPENRACTYRFVEVPADAHQRFKYADVLPLFQMIAKNVGIRRARGRFVLATNMDIIFSTSVIEYMASGELQAGCLYRVDRHDIESAFPIEAPLEEQMRYCASHLLRIHTRWGSYPVDNEGRRLCIPEDIVDGRAVRLGEGWHVRESAGGGQFFRWASDRAELILDSEAVGLHGAVMLEVELASNPYDEASWVEIMAVDGPWILAKERVTGQMSLRIHIGAVDGRRRIELRVINSHPESRRQLPVFERRDSMHYRVLSARLRAATGSTGQMFDYPASLWTNAYENSEVTLTSTAEGIAVSSDPRKWSYCLSYGPLRAPRRGLYRFDVAWKVLEGGATVGVLSRNGRFWIPTSVIAIHEGPLWRFEIEVDLAANETFSIVVYNNHPDGDAVSRLVVMGLRGSVDPSLTIVEAAHQQRRLHMRPLADRRAVTYAKLAHRARKLRKRIAGNAGWRDRISLAADKMARLITSAVGDRLRYRMVHLSPEFRSLESAALASDAQLRELAPLRDLQPLYGMLRDRRPENLHVNGCGDFQLMAREDWLELRGYPEFETFSMNIDGLFSYIADAAGIRERVLPMAIYHLEHEVGSGWSPEGEALLRKRIAERGITWLDAPTVYVWAAYMRWLGRPMIVNSSSWGMANQQLPERIFAPADGVTT
jgi:hypothetical protein